jgi:hypothetical protein
MNSCNQAYSEPQRPSDGDRGQHVGGALFGRDVPEPPLFEWQHLSDVSGRITSFWVPAR